MNPITKKTAIPMTRLLPAVLVALALLLTTAANAAAPGVTGSAFHMTAKPAFVSQPDGNAVYSWGYSCDTGGSPTPFGSAGTAFGGTMQGPGPTLIVNAPASGNATFSVTLTNGLPTPAGNTSILFPGFQVATSGGVAGLLTQGAQPGGAVIYTITVPSTAAGTHSYHSGTQSDLQVEMGLYGALIVLPSSTPAACTSGIHGTNLAAQGIRNETNFRLAPAAYNHPGACYDREYMFQFSEIDPRIHREAEEQILAAVNCAAEGAGCAITVATEPYVPAYFMINGRSMPDDMDANYAPEYPHQ